MFSLKPRPNGKRLIAINRFVGFAFLLVASTWVALVNGQPLFSIDTTAYVRGADFAVVYFLGPKFATSWTQERTLEGVEHHQPHNVGDGKYGGEVSLNSPFDKTVMAGRSIYYGAFLYLGHISSQFWLVVFAQAAIFLYLSYIIIVLCLRLSFFSFLCVTVVTLVATPVSFFICSLMPDVYAGFLILGVIILIEFWDSLKYRDRVILFVIVLYSALTHTSHLLLLILIVSIYAMASVLIRRIAKPPHKSVRNILAVLLALSLAGIFGELAFSYGVRRTIGTDPIRPPFLMARLIADGPGYNFLQKNCTEKTYTVCKYINRLPVSGGDFLWSTSLKNGVFSVADVPTRIALSSEQLPFAIDVFRSDPVRVVESAMTDFFHQFFLIELNSFLISHVGLEGFAASLPKPYFDAMMRARVVTRDDLLRNFSSFYAATYYISLCSLLLIAIFLSWMKLQKMTELFRQQEWVSILTLVALAIISNAAICGILSGAASRYQTRISWIPLFMIGLIIAKYCERKRSSPTDAGNSVRS